MEPSDVSREARAALFVRFPEAQTGLTTFHDLLATSGVERGLIGPRETPRLWDRHLVNCAVVSELIPVGHRVADVGSGAGLPGLVLALVRPDLVVTLIEPLARRSSFLEEAVRELNLGERVDVIRGRAQDQPAGTYDTVTSRAVAPLERLSSWCLPLVKPGGQVVAIKGARAHEEVTAARGSLPMGVEVNVRVCGVDVIDPPTTVVTLVMG